MTDLDHPLDEVLANAEKLIEAGANVYQKFTCANCGNRLTMEKPNIFYKTGSCDKCGHVTNIEESGCNYLLLWTSKETGGKKNDA